MPKFFAPADKPTDWQRLLAKPDLHWKTGRSAKSIAYSWTEAEGFPSEIKAVLDDSIAACLLDVLELDRADVGEVGYQLLHRTASAISRSILAGSLAKPST